MSFSKVVITKSELLRLKKRLVFIKKGHDLLELKAESILVQIKSFYKSVQDMREKTVQGVTQSFEDLEKAEVESGEHALKLLADVNKKLIDYSIIIDYRSSFGFTVPKIKFNIEREKKLPHYGFADTSAFLDRYYKQMQQSIEDLIKLAELENTLFIMANEYRKIRRRINALEQIIIPQTEKQIKLIEDELEENKQEEFTRLKKIKEKVSTVSMKVM